MPAVRRCVVDVLKPHEPPIIEFAERIAEVESVEGVTASLIELDTEVQNVKLTLEGADLAFDAVEGAIDALGASVHSIDQVAVGEYVVEDRRTLQDG